MCVKRALASSAALAASRGRRNTLGDDSMAATDRISLEHLHVCINEGAGRGRRGREGGPTEEQARTLSGALARGNSGPVRLLLGDHAHQPFMSSYGATPTGEHRAHAANEDMVSLCMCNNT